MSALMASYRRQPVVMSRGAGATLWDSDGRRYLDLIAGIAVCSLGHAHPAVAAAITDQANTLLHCSNLYRIDEQERLGARLCALSGLDRAFFCNSGAEANEAALKLARLHGHASGIATPHIVVTDTAFHGRTLATISATGNNTLQQGFGPLLPGFIVVPWNDLDAIETLASERDDIAAIFVEPIQGEGGIRVPDDAYLAGLRTIADRRDWLLMLDEIQTGMGRTGRWFAHQHAGVRPDVMTLAKALGNGMPIGACLAGGAAAELVQPGSHGSTFGGNPLACRTALAVIDALERDALPARALEIGEHFLAGLNRRLHNIPDVVDVRGVGGMIGIELREPCGDLVAAALAEGVLLNVTAGNVIRLLPPLVITDAEIEHGVDVIGGLVERFCTVGSDAAEPGDNSPAAAGVA